MIETLKQQYIAVSFQRKETDKGPQYPERIGFATNKRGIVNIYIFFYNIDIVELLFS